MLGITFKENCRCSNTKIINVIKALTDYGIVVSTYDPVAKPEAVYKEYGIKPIKKSLPKYDACVLGVSHTSFILRHYFTTKPLSVVYDIKGILGNKRMVVYSNQFYSILI
jgi:UDP-N-acetyl-D-galactosamine dehydrogenase